jgi:hypothetical protein
VNGKFDPDPAAEAVLRAWLENPALLRAA